MASHAHLNEHGGICPSLRATAKENDVSSNFVRNAADGFASKNAPLKLFFKANKRILSVERTESRTISAWRLSNKESIQSLCGRLSSGGSSVVC